MVETIYIAIRFADDSVGIMQYVMNDGHNIKRHSIVSTEIDAEIAKSSFDAHKLPVKGWKVLPGKQDDLPQDREFRDAWSWQDGKVTHDMVRAREIHRNRLRERRKPLLEKLDVDYMKAMESGDASEMSKISERKKVLRDVTQNPEIESASDVDQLKQHRPI